jgi:hypothetical protein
VLQSYLSYSFVVPTLSPILSDSLYPLSLELSSYLVATVVHFETAHTHSPSYQLYIYLAILFYIGIYVENDTKAYWSYRENRPIHIVVHKAMGEN